MESHHQEEEWDRLPAKRRMSLTSLAADTKPPPVHFYALKMSDEQLKNVKNKAVKQFYEVTKTTTHSQTNTY
jgi:hypothetical protein